MIISSLLSNGASSSNIVSQVEFLILLLIVTLIVARLWKHFTPEWHSRFPRPRPVPSAWRPVMVLSGLRGALSLALVLSLPIELEQRDLLTDIVYGVILVTLLGQGLTLRVLLPRWKEKLVRAEAEEPLPSKA